MNDYEVNAQIDYAAQQGYIEAFQASQLKEEVAMFPGSNIIKIMLGRGMITPEQATELDRGPGEQTPPPSDELDMDFDVPSASTPPFTTFPQSNFNSPGLNQQVSPTPPAQPASPAWQPPPAQAPAPAPSAPETPTTRRTMADALAAARNAINVTVVQPSDNIEGIDSELLSLFQLGRSHASTDLHLTPEKPPYLRQEGLLQFLDKAPLTAADTQRMIWSILTPEQREMYNADYQVDFSFEHEDVGRFRANVYRQRRGMEGAFRFINPVVPTLADLKMPAALEKLTTYPQGLNLVTGPGGSGKSTTVAAMLEHINVHRHDHIITVEDPVEYVFQPKNCQITQREVGKHTGSFSLALRTALRQDPDVIMIGELRDLDTTSIAITAAETGHLVFGTLHTASAVRTVARILDVYPPSQRAQICVMVAESLRGIISQQLLRRKDGQGRVCAMEILIVTTGVSQVIKEGKTHQLVSHMQSGSKLGMKSMDDSVMDLYKTGLISGSVAWSAADNKSLFDSVRAQV